LEAVVTTYLSTAHRDDPSHGCPLAALGSEIARCDEKTRAAATEGFLKLVDIIGGQFGKTTPDAARRRALTAASTMIGALTMARITTVPELSAEILRDVGKQVTLK
jgi:TetR/AcrR family transcriptional regulator, transcriptional repressor for nem operon